MRLAPPLLTGLLLLGSAPGYAQENPGVVVMDLKAVHEVEESLAAILNDSLVARLKATGKFGSILSGPDMRAMLNLEQQKQVLNCDEQSCLAEIGGALGVPYLVHANLGKVGAKFVLSVKVMDVNGAEVVGSSLLRIKTEDDLLDGVDNGVDKAVAEAFPDKPKPVAAKTSKALKKESPTVVEKPDSSASQNNYFKIAAVLVAAGGLSMGGGLAVINQAQGNFDEAVAADSVDTSDLEALEGQYATGNGLLGGGALLAVVGALGMVLFP